MTEHIRSDLKQLQDLDTKIMAAEQKFRDFDPLFAEVEEPALTLESELTTARNRLQELKLEERRLELSIEERGSRVKRLEERLGSVRNLREEAAVSSELDLVRRSLQGDEQETFTLLDQMSKLDARLADLEVRYAEAQAAVEPKKQELLDARSSVEADLRALQAERESFTSRLDAEELRMYDGIRLGGKRTAVSELTEDGACGNCFGMVPLQLQNQIRHGDDLIRCEGCGVILTAPGGRESPQG
jgi:predicted  nucleic acid-binding Zn-ribbon protein